MMHSGKKIVTHDQTWPKYIWSDPKVFDMLTRRPGNDERMNYISQPLTRFIDFFSRNCENY